MDRQAVSAFGSAIAQLDLSVVQNLRISEPGNVAIAAVMARLGQDRLVAAQLAKLPNAMQAKVIAIGPGNWLARVNDPSVNWLGDLSKAIGGSANAFDQSGGYGLLELAGRDGRRLLQKGIFADLETLLAQDGASICSVIAHINVIVWNSGTDCLTLAVPRSFASSFWHWLTVSAAAENIQLSK